MIRRESPQYAACAGLLLATTLVVSSARADDPAGAATAKREAGAADHPQANNVPLQVTLEAETPDRWLLTLTNRGNVPLQVAADARLLRVEVIGAPTAERTTRPGPKAPTKPAPTKLYGRGKLPTCQMPAAMRPATPTPERSLLLQPGERYQEAVSPVALCGASGVAAELGPGAILYPRFGWPDAKKTRGHAAPSSLGPVVADVPRGTSGGGGPWRWVDGVPLLLPPRERRGPTDAPSVASASVTPTENGQPAAPTGAQLSLTGPPRRDAIAAHDASLTVAVRNTGQQATWIHLRPDNVSFAVTRVTSQTKAVDCGNPFVRRGAAREFFSTLRAGASRSVTVLLGELCPHGTFDQPGVYALMPRLTLAQTGDAYQIHAITTDIDAAAPTFLRIQRGPLPYHNRPPEALPPADATDVPPP